MKVYDFEKYLKNPDIVNEKIREFMKNNIIKQSTSKAEITGHINKAENNLNFVNQIKNTDFTDWAVTGCYYTSYHAALALIISRGLFSKNHLATLLILIREFYDSGLDKEDIQYLSTMLDYQDILFYVESKNKREDATYSTKISFSKNDVEELRVKTILFVSKVKNILKED